MSMRKSASVSILKKRMDAVFSRFIRQRDKHTCYTCGLRMEANRSQNGHFIPRQYLSLRYSEVNCHCQCYACNMLYNGQPSAYALHLILDYGEDIIEKLERERRKITKLTPEYYETEIDRYSKLLSVL